MLDKFIQQLVKELELEGSLATEVPGVYILPLDENLAVTLTDKGQGILLSTTLCSIPQNSQEEFFERALLGNLFGQGTKDAVLGLNEDGTQLVLQQLIPDNVDYKEFREILEDFINSIDYWISESKNYK